jgi:hypothetical protein
LICENIVLRVEGWTVPAIPRESIQSFDFTNFLLHCQTVFEHLIGIRVIILSEFGPKVCECQKEHVVGIEGQGAMNRGKNLFVDFSRSADSKIRIERKELPEIGHGFRVMGDGII